MNAVALYSFGFDSVERGDIAASANETDFDYRTITGREDLSDEGPAGIVVRVTDSNELDDLRAWMTDEAHLHFIVAVPPGERSLFVAVGLLRPFMTLPLPVDEDELSRALRKLRGYIDSTNAEKAVYAGLIEAEVGFSWRTDEIRVSRVARETIGLLSKGGLFHRAAGFERAVLAVEEALVNAVDHGNLELDSSLKQGTLKVEDEYETLKTERLESAVYGERLVTLRISVSESGAEVVIGDQGEGFDTRSVNRMLDEVRDGRREKILEVSGKGLALMAASFDELHYNDRGNELTMIKRSPGSGRRER